MNLNQEKYARFSLCKEMLETCEVVKNYNQDVVAPYLDAVKSKKKIFITGEGSSRIFPAKHIIYKNLQCAGEYTILTEGSTQAKEYKLSDFSVFGMTNSGKTKELVNLFNQLKSVNHPSLFGITANGHTPITEKSDTSTVLSCGKEEAVAATKSVVEQALFFDALLLALNGKQLPGLESFSSLLEIALCLEIDPKITKTLSKASKIYIAGRNNGVGEELALKTNEITRKRSMFLEGTFAVHGIEEVMDNTEAMILIDPFEDEEAKFKQALQDGVGIDIVAISTRLTSFPTIQVPDGGFFHNYIELATGWNLLVEIGLHLGINLDKGLRARKIGNEVLG